MCQGYQCGERASRSNLSFELCLVVSLVHYLRLDRSMRGQIKVQISFIHLKFRLIINMVSMHIPKMEHE